MLSLHGVPGAPLGAKESEKRLRCCLSETQQRNQPVSHYNRINSASRKWEDGSRVERECHPRGHHIGWSGRMTSRSPAAESGKGVAGKEKGMSRAQRPALQCVDAASRGSRHMAANARWVDMSGHEASSAALSLPWFSSAGRDGGRPGSGSARPCSHWPPGFPSSQANSKCADGPSQGPFILSQAPQRSGFGAEPKVGLLVESENPGGGLATFFHMH